MADQGGCVAQHRHTADGVRGAALAVVEHAEHRDFAAGQGVFDQAFGIGRRADHNDVGVSRPGLTQAADGEPPADVQQIEAGEGETEPDAFRLPDAIHGAGRGQGADKQDRGQHDGAGDAGQMDHHGLARAKAVRSGGLQAEHQKHGAEREGNHGRHRAHPYPRRIGQTAGQPG